MYYHGENIHVNVAISNRSNKTVKKIKITGKVGYSSTLELKKVERF